MTGEAVRTCHVVQERDRHEVPFTRERVTELLGRGSFFWLDLDRPSEDDFEILRDVFGFHPLAVEDSEQFDQRAKLDDYDDFVFLVVYGASPDGDRLMVALLFYSGLFPRTVHHEHPPALPVILRRFLPLQESMARSSLLLL